MSSESVESPCIKWSSSSILWSCLRERDWWSVRLTDGLVRCLQWCNGVSSCCGEEGAELIYIPTLMRFGLWPKEQSHRCKWSKWVFFPQGGRRDKARSSVRCSGCIPLERSPSTSGSSLKSWRRCVWIGKSRHLCSYCWPHNQTPDKWKKWMDGWKGMGLCLMRDNNNLLGFLKQHCVVFQV